MNASGAYVTFEPGARLALHTHPSGQYLVVTAGVGAHAAGGKPVQEIKPGEMAWCPPGVKHWHGSAPETAMTHIAVTGVDEQNRNVERLEKVSDRLYKGEN
ncbi:cupin domain-containing protein [Stutzerimonas azotifigens]|uniref:Cupin domain-containing protein n=1 Tax=Stutzerimonas azotifigens TaxID=291995 RepID=A0ABR5Z696_9GAMM|nr:cupin domain-containing protein [Stutzerimonas azotifigens]